MTLEEFVTMLENCRLDPEEEIRITSLGDTATPQEILNVERVCDEDKRWYTEITLRNT